MAQASKKTLEELERRRQGLATAADAVSRYALSGYTPTDEQTRLKAEYDRQKSALANYAAYSNPNAPALSAAREAVINRTPFTFKTDGDALYERYKNTYQQMGKQAMQDTVGQAAMLTGGYGNSYAAAAGAQAYNQYLSRMNDVIPQLYQLALDKYNAEGSALKDRYNMLLDEDQLGYSRWQNERAIQAEMADRARSDYSDEYNRAYGEWGDRGTLLNTAYNVANSLYGNALDRENAEYTRSYQNERNARADAVEDRDYARQLARDAASDAQWQKNFDRSNYEYDTNLALQKARYARSDFESDRAYNRDVYESDRAYNYNAAQDQMANDLAREKIYASGGSSASSSSGGQISAFSELGKDEQADLRELAENGSEEAILDYLEGIGNISYDGLLKIFAVLQPILDRSNYGRDDISESAARRIESRR